MLRFSMLFPLSLHDIWRCMDIVLARKCSILRPPPSPHACQTCHEAQPGCPASAVFYWEWPFHVPLADGRGRIFCEHACKGGPERSGFGFAQRVDVYSAAQAVDNVVAIHHKSQSRRDHCFYSSDQRCCYATRTVSIARLRRVVVWVRTPRVDARYLTFLLSW